MKRGIYILPNLFTLGNIFCGFYALIAALKNQFQVAAIAILAAVIFDGIDGRIARLTNTCSRFGIEFDSLADLISFGAAPGLLIYLWALQPFERIGWLASFLFLVCGALRLARFNCQVNTDESKSFTGLPIPAAAGTISSFIILHQFLFGPDGRKPIIIALMAYILAFLMVSTIRYRSLKELKLKERKPFNVLVLTLLLLLVIIAEPKVMLFIVFLIYVMSGPAQMILTHAKGIPSYAATKGHALKGLERRKR
ncbi:CDP-diacylglycerol--serine O-phosphatidyltransferase [bacterium]|nr:CDP-diacylglycerol--serine O-phosphatidyltransferase [bacterium]